MIVIYCAGMSHGKELCPSCRELLDYACGRLSACPFGGRKTSCRKCRVHCYRPDMALRIRAVMRYAGPRMLSHNPFAAIRHLLSEL